MKKNGFTLIEVLVALVILSVGILVGVVPGLGLCGPGVRRTRPFIPTLGTDGAKEQAIRYAA